MKTNILNILGVIALVVTLCIIGFAVWYFFSGSSPAGGFAVPAGGLGNYREAGSREITGEVVNVEVAGVSGDIQLIAWGESFARVEYEKRAASQRALDDLEIITQLVNGRLVIRAQGNNRPPAAGGDASFTVYLPPSVISIDARTVSGAIRVTDKDSRPERLESISQRLATTSGGIITRGAGDLKMNSVSGSLEFAAGGSRISGETISGRVRGTITGAADTQDIEFETVSGSVSLKLPEQWGGTVDLESVSGSLTVRQALTSQEKRRTRLSGQIGGGTARLQVETVSGSVTVE